MTHKKLKGWTGLSSLRISVKGRGTEGKDEIFLGHSLGPGDTDSYLLNSATLVSVALMFNNGIWIRLKNKGIQRELRRPGLI